MIQSLDHRWRKYGIRAQRYNQKHMPFEIRPLRTPASGYFSLFALRVRDTTYRLFLCITRSIKMTRCASTQVDTHWPQQYRLMTDYAAWLKAVPPMKREEKNTLHTPPDIGWNWVNIVCPLWQLGIFRFITNPPLQNRRTWMKGCGRRLTILLELIT